jgi:hypothetical protein
MAGDCSGGESDSTPFTDYYGLQRFDFARSSLEEIHGQRNEWGISPGDFHPEKKHALAPGSDCKR